MDSTRINADDGDFFLLDELEHCGLFLTAMLARHGVDVVKDKLEELGSRYRLVDDGDTDHEQLVDAAAADAVDGIRVSGHDVAIVVNALRWSSTDMCKCAELSKAAPRVAQGLRNDAQRALAMADALELADAFVIPFSAATTSDAPRVDVSAQVALAGVSITVSDGCSIAAYKSPSDGRLVIEVDTESGAKLPRSDDDAVPQMKVVLNEAVLHDEPAAAPSPPSQ